MKSNNKNNKMSNKERTEKFNNEYNSIRAIYIDLAKKLVNSLGDLEELNERASRLYDYAIDGDTVHFNTQIRNKCNKLDNFIDQTYWMIKGIDDFKKFTK